MPPSTISPSATLLVSSASSSVGVTSTSEIVPSVSLSTSSTSISATPVTPTTSVIQPSTLLTESTLSSMSIIATSTIVPSTAVPSCVFPPSSIHFPGQGLLLDYGSNNDDQSFDETSANSDAELTTDIGVPIFGVIMTKIYISMKGLITFDRPYDGYAPPDHRTPLPDTFKVAHVLSAPYFADFDLSGGGVVYYRAYDLCTNASAATEVNVLTIAEVIKEVYGLATFVPAFVLQVTWYSVHRRNGSDSERATFQLALGTDGVSTYMIYTYEYGSMTLDVGGGGNVFIGYVTGRANSHYKRMENNEHGTYLLRPDVLFIHNCIRGFLAFKMTELATELPNHRQQCCSWYNQELPNLPTYLQNWSQMPKCPCSTAGLVFAQGYGSTYNHTSDPSISCVDLKPGATFNEMGMKCCYDESLGAHVTDGSGRGYYSRWNPRITGLEIHQVADDISRHDLCCNQAGNSSQLAGGARFCDMFYEVRPPPTCNLSLASEVAASFSDPHFMTFDDYEFTFNGWGDYTLMRIDSAGFVLQARTDVVKDVNGNPTQATIFRAFAARDDNGVNVHVELNNDDTEMNIWFDGVDVTRQFNDNSTFAQEIVGLSVSRVNITAVVSFLDADIDFNVTFGIGMLALSVRVPDKYSGLAVGLLGNVNGDPGDDLTPPGETASLDTQTVTELEIFQYGQQWLVTEAENILRYHENGLTFAYYVHTDFTPVFMSQIPPDVYSAAVLECGSTTDRECIYDFAITNSSLIAADTKRIKELVVLDKVDIARTSPVLTAVYGLVSVGSSLTAQVVSRREHTFTVQAAYDGGITFKFHRNTAGATLTQIPNDRANVTFTLDSDIPQDISVTATDTQGLSASAIQVVVVLCSGCSDHGTCDYITYRPDPRTTDFFKYAACLCTPYWEGEDCFQDLDGCVTDPCSSGALATTCTDVPAARHQLEGLAYECSSCPDGYLVVDNQCAEIDECATGTDDCQQVCINIAGSFDCQCLQGYRQTNRSHCDDVNECDEAQNDCQHVCTNTPGGYVCSCHGGYQYNDLARTCDLVAVEPGCDAIDCSLAAGCTVDIGGNAGCFCKSGYGVQDDGTCANTDECLQNSCAQICTDNIGSYTCSCLAGFSLDTDKTSCSPCSFPSYGVNCGLTCTCSAAATEGCDAVKGCRCLAGWTGTDCDVDVDECTDPVVCSDVNSVCVNGVGSFSCQCRTGYQMDELRVCVDTDECVVSELNTCQQDCINTVGGFSCSCFPGYMVNATNPQACVDVDECAAGIDECNQICVNKVGSYNCQCVLGYLLNIDRTTCAEADNPCVSVAELQCSDMCVLEADRAYCACGPGFVLGADNQTCIDVNECDPALDLNMCSQLETCLNNVGGYVCSCSVGYKLESDGRTCSPCDEYHYGADCQTPCNCGVGAERCDAVTGCVCGPGWSGNDCTVDRDECLGTSGVCTGDNVVCQNTHGNYTCPCAAGYARDEASACVDEDECSSPGLNDCGQTCTNTPGSYTCSCRAGFLQAGNLCEDIDECLGHHDCSHSCYNSYTFGGYGCTCPPGYRLLLQDKRTCIPEAECTSVEASSCPANADCAVIDGAAVCTCTKGFQPDPTDPTQCIDIRECDSSPCSDTCLELEGGYQCACSRPGYYLDVDAVTCAECVEGTYGNNCTGICPCDVTTTVTCNGSTGVCECAAGWQGDTCVADVDECADAAIHQCPGNSTCVNTAGSFYCQCRVGMVAADNTCQECNNRHYGQDCSNTCACSPASTSRCDPVTGGCTCRAGWMGDTCDTDVNECLANPCGSALQTCENTEGSYTCRCLDGYTMNDQMECQDEDECLQGTSTCTSLCTNTLGGYACSCPDGYTGTGTGTGNDCTECATGRWGPQCVNTCTCHAVHSITCDKATGCVCYSNWTGTGCDTDVDECSAGIDDCPANSRCINTVGGFSCECLTGYTLSAAGTCDACTGKTFGDGCSLPCDCIHRHSETPAQSCDHVTGACNCVSTWTGPRCETDVNECMQGTSLCELKPNQGCHNFAGGFECSCYIGFQFNEINMCSLIDVTTTPYTPSDGHMLIPIFISISALIPDYTDLNVTATFDLYAAELTSELRRLYAEILGALLIDVIVTPSSNGSLLANYLVVIEDSEDARAKFTLVHSDILRNANLTLFGETENITGSAINGSDVPVGIEEPLNTLLCQIYVLVIDGCQPNFECTVENETPSCQLITTADNYGLIIGLSLGIPGFFLVAALTACCFIFLVKRRRIRRRRRREYVSDVIRRKSDLGSDIFATAMPTRFSPMGRMAPFYGSEYSSDDLDRDTARVTSTHGAPSIQLAPPIHRDVAPSIDDSDYTVRVGFEQDDVVESNFSWDFLYPRMDTYNQFEIQRPTVEQEPNPIYSDSDI